MMICTKLVSFPTRERGLKRLCLIGKLKLCRVVPYAGTWMVV